MKLFTALFVAFILLFAPALLSFGIREIPFRSQGSLVNRHKIYGDIVARQEFISHKNNLSAIAATIRNFNLLNKKDMSLSVISEGKVVRQVAVSGANIPDGALVKFKFDRISDSLGKEYTLTLSSPDSTSAEAFELYFGEDNKTIALSDYYQTSSKIELIGDIYKSFLVRFFAGRFFAGLYLIAIGSSVVYLRVGKFT